MAPMRYWDAASASYGGHRKPNRKLGSRTKGTFDYPTPIHSDTMHKTRPRMVYAKPLMTGLL